MARLSPQRDPFALPAVILCFHGWLRSLVGRKGSDTPVVSCSLERRATVKDMIEASGVPHTEVGCIKVDGIAAGFHHLPLIPCRVDVFPWQPPVDVLSPYLLRPSPLPAIRFLVDVNVGGLAGKLRMAGFDTLYDPAWLDSDLARIAEEQQCILLSRDRNLLKRKKIAFGHLVRAITPDTQLIEVIAFFGLGGQIKPFSRCMRCNGKLVGVEKQTIRTALQPLTRKYYHSFQQCAGCGHLYWPGSHREKMERVVRLLVS